MCLKAKKVLVFLCYVVICFYLCSGNNLNVSEMSNRKKTPKVKEAIKLRYKKLANGNKSIYLAHWNNSNNKWEYEFLKDLYIVPETTPANKESNENTLRLANAIKAKRIVELQNNAHGFTNNGTRSKVNVIEYIKAIAEKKRIKAGGSERGTFQSYIALIRQLEAYGDLKTTFKQVDKNYCNGFLSYLRTAKNLNKGIKGKPLNENTQYVYMKLFEAVLNAAISDEIIIVNPFKQIKSESKPKNHKAEICYLTIDELKALEAIQCYNPIVKQAFLFSCYSGLRFSDICNLTWEKLQRDNAGGTFINFVQKKVSKHEYLPIPQKALNNLPARNGAKDTDKVFNLQTSVLVNLQLRQWAFAAGIKKHVTFHVARHTYATLLLTKGAPIETVSKNLGHAEIRTTQIYAKVVNAAQRAAVDLLDTI